MAGRGVWKNEGNEGETSGLRKEEIECLLEGASLCGEDLEESDLLGSGEVSMEEAQLEEEGNKLVDTW